MELEELARACTARATCSTGEGTGSLSSSCCSSQWLEFTLPPSGKSSLQAGALRSLGQEHRACRAPCCSTVCFCGSRSTLKITCLALAACIASLIPSHPHTSLPAHQQSPPLCTHYLLPALFCQCLVLVQSSTALVMPPPNTHPAYDECRFVYLVVESSSPTGAALATRPLLHNLKPNPTLAAIGTRPP